MTANGRAAIRGRVASPASRRVTDALLWLTAALNVLFVVGLVVSGGDNNALVTVWLTLATQWVPVAIFWLVAVRTGFTRLPVVLAAAGVTSSASGDVYYSLAMDSEGYLASPSPADAAYLLFYPLMVAAVVLIVRPRLRGAGGLVLIETAVAAAGASAVLAALLGPVIHESLAGDDAAESLVALAYPLFDILLLAVIVGAAAVGTVRIGRRWWALIAGLGIFAAADIAYAMLVHEDAYVAGTPLDAAWAIGLGFLTWWVAGVPGASTEHAPAARRGSLVSLPAVSVVAGLAVLVVGTQVRVSLLAVVLAALTVGLGAAPIVFRQAMLGRLLAAREESVRRLIELDQDKTDLMVTLNHEFRTPLTSVIGHAELLLDGDAGELPPTAVDMIRTIERNGERLQLLIDEMLTASVFDHGPDRLTLARVDVAEVVARVVARFASEAERRGVALIVERDGAEPVIDADEAQIERALGNIVDNAVKFSAADGRVTVGVEAAATGDELVVRVHDDGIGIPADDLPRLFSRFFRASNVQNAAIPGMGLGLPIAQQIVQAHGGTIEVDSEENRGTTMTVRLPRKRS